MPESIHVAVVAGGPSSEAAVSQRSAAAVGAALREAGFRVSTLELDSRLAGELQTARPDVVFPTTHGPLGEDGCLQGLLEVLGVRYVGSDVRASAIAAHKPTAKIHFRALGLPVADDVLITSSTRDDAVERVRQRLGTLVVVKPGSGGSAIGVTRLTDTAAPDLWALELGQALDVALATDDFALVERLHVGLEVTCGVLDDGSGPRALPPTLIHAQAADWYDFSSRYAAGGSRHECPAPFSAERTAEVQRLAVAAHVAVGARDLSRIDFVVGDAITVLEVNTLPGMTETSNYPEAVGVTGVGFAELCRLLVERALSRPLRVAPQVVPIPR